MEIKIRYTVKRENGFTFSRIFKLAEIEQGKVKDWMRENHINEKDIIAKNMFTGQKDSTRTDKFPNGKDVYEGDSIETETGLTGKVVYNEKYKCFVIKTDTNEHVLYAFEMVEIVGGR